MQQEITKRQELRNLRLISKYSMGKLPTHSFIVFSFYVIIAKQWVPGISMRT